MRAYGYERLALVDTRQQLWRVWRYLRAQEDTLDAMNLVMDAAVAVTRQINGGE